MGRTAGDTRSERRPVLVRTSALVALGSLTTAALAVATTLALRPPDAMPRPGAFGVLPGSVALEPLSPSRPPSVAGGHSRVADPARAAPVELSGAARPAAVNVATRAATARAATARTATARAATAATAVRASATAAATTPAAALAGGSNLAARAQQDELLGSGRAASAAASTSDGELARGLPETDAGAVPSPVVDAVLPLVIPVPPGASQSPEAPPSEPTEPTPPSEPFEPFEQTEPPPSPSESTPPPGPESSESTPSTAGTPVPCVTRTPAALEAPDRSEPGEAPEPDETPDTPDQLETSEPIAPSEAQLTASAAADPGDQGNGQGEGASGSDAGGPAPDGATSGTG